jgi:membrane-bound inhibitor of C-type lysozyme
MSIREWAALLGALASLTGAAPACAQSLQVPGIRTGAPHVYRYTCASGKSLRVTYWNAANHQGFALVPVDGQPRLFVDTLSASGARYQAGRYVWWTKGPRADLYDETAGANAPPVLAGCVAPPG